MCKALCRESSSEGFKEEAPQPCSASQGFPCSATQELLQGVDLPSAPTTRELLSSFTGSNTFLNYKIFFFSKKRSHSSKITPVPTHPARRTLQNNSWGAAREEKMHNIISLTLFAVMGLNCKKIKELRPRREPRAEAGLGKFPIPGSDLACVTRPLKAIPAQHSPPRFCKQDKPPPNPFLEHNPGLRGGGQGGEQHCRTKATLPRGC